MRNILHSTNFQKHKSLGCSIFTEEPINIKLHFAASKVVYTYKQNINCFEARFIISLSTYILLTKLNS